MLEVNTKVLRFDILNNHLILLILIFKNFKRTLNDDDKDIQQINNSFSEIIRIQPTADPTGEIRTKVKELNTRWDILNGQVNETLKNV